jgi:hypothetical protein
VTNTQGSINTCQESQCKARQLKREKRQQLIRDIPWIIGALILFFVAGSVESLVEYIL